MPFTLKIASWNIAGGHTIRSNKQFDYDEQENIEYFIGQLLALDADVICLQESHWHPEKSLSYRIAAALDFPFVFETINSPSGIDPAFKESTAVLSKAPLENTQEFCLPYPKFDLFLPDGSPAARWDKYLQVCEIQGVRIGNIHTQPLGYFGYNYQVEAGVGYAKEIEILLTQQLKEPFILVGDFNTQKANRAFERWFQANSLDDALPEQLPTRPNGNHIDYILHTPAFIKHDSGIISTNTDHYLCWAEFTVI
ncbi:endonuclease/exonuclease/phosphatase family protein [Polaromonas sp.]|nr:endonuclease/exonuclease/phosphatase family protein [Candidatus Saccharibacteria bacterium]